MDNQAQKHHSILLELDDGRKLEAVRNGNNAAWLCVCGYHLPLIWSSHLAKNRPFTVCSQCGRKFKGDLKGKNDNPNKTSKIMEVA